MTKKLFVGLCFTFFAFQPSARADFWGGDLPLLSQIVLNTLHTLSELESQTSLLRDQMAGIKDRIERIKTISALVQPSTWDDWRDPQQALKRLREIYYTVPKEYRTDKADEIEQELSRAMATISKIGPEAGTTFQSGKELERRGADASPGVAQKLTASGVGTLVALDAQSLVLQSHITSLLTQMLASSNEKEARSLVAAGTGFQSLSRTLDQRESSFSRSALSLGRAK
jgi:hypothetical protein